MLVVVVGCVVVVVLDVVVEVVVVVPIFVRLILRLVTSPELTLTGSTLEIYPVALKVRL